METSLEQRFLETYEASLDEVFRFAYFKLLDRDQARDVTQEAFVRTWEYLAKGKDVENLRAFVYRVANNIMLDMFRKKPESSLEELQETGFDAAVDERERFLLEQEIEDMKEKLELLPVQYREVLTLRYVNDFSVKEVAEILGQSENNTSVRIHRAIAALRKQILSDLESKKKRSQTL